MKKLRQPIRQDRLKELARSNPEPVVQELLWEILRLQWMLDQDRQDIELIRQAWTEEVGGSLVAIHVMRSRLIGETGK
ncbi:hypothetical protein FHW67_002696 [Herbaspirillum sp. Sphag1AN]|uniref:hypothetical protein n=1 Tax=unclassified Herbaspirillum TaxID=2624150 RepID=UPI001618E312|nr:MULTISPECIES: hypothetical protein [unclassified Herbaspirillum]MBB3213404.1 hypothetical protein [Herbaspirillum sp. Sphag1AN]MBB3246552.1 hypothetical protein [Herbaspirillum sp. Sphag64]